MLATSSLLHSSNQFSLESMTASLVRSPNSMMEIADVTADSLLTKRGRIVGEESKAGECCGNTNQ
jgi:hypothetical protein